MRAGESILKKRKCQKERGRASAPSQSPRSTLAWIPEMEEEEKEDEEEEENLGLEVGSMPVS